MRSFAEFAVDLTHPDYRRALRLDPKIASRQKRVAAKFPSKSETLPMFVEQINRWLPGGRGRLLWIDHWSSSSLYDVRAFITAARAGFGENRPIEDAPGHLFDAHPYDKLDFGEITDPESTDCGTLAGLVILIIVSASDGWLIAPDATDRIEFWEGNVFFYSESQARLTDAHTLLQRSDCALWPAGG